MHVQKTVPISLPIVIGKEGKWFIAACPLLDLATQGRTEKEVKENMQDLIKEFFADPDTKKPSLEEISSASLSLVNVPVKLKV